MKTFNNFLIEEYTNLETNLKETNKDITLVSNNSSSLPIPSITDFKTVSRKGIITVISLMLDQLNRQYMEQHNGDSLWGKGSIYRKLMSK